MKNLENIILSNCTPLDPIPTDTAATLAKLSGIKAILFDVYGTLFVSGSGDVGTATATDTSEALMQSLQAAGFNGDFQQAGLTGKPLLKEKIVAWHKSEKMKGADFPEVEITQIWKSILDQLCNDGLLTSAGITTEQVQQLAVEYECRVNPVYPMPHALETITALHKSGHVLGIVSNAQFYTPLLFPAFFAKDTEACGFDPELCIWSYRKLRAKPSTELFPKAARVLRETYGIELEETVYVGNDMLNDIYCAQKAGCKTVLFAGDKRSLRLRENDERCKDIKPDAIVTSLEQLLEIV